MKKIKLVIIGKGIEVEKIQKRLRCAALAVNLEINLSWVHAHPSKYYPKTLNTVIVTYNENILIDGLIRTEEIETILKKVELLGETNE